MTQEQFERWKDFALRMADNGFTRITKDGRRRVREMVEQYFDCLTPEEIAATTDWDSKPYPCDRVAEWMQEWNPHYWGRNDRAYEEWDERWGTRVRCCIRAGLDVASEPSGGVIGFTVGDLRRMYPDGLPDWLDADWRDADEKQISLSAAPDDVSVWL